jgi:hypothetical protein
MPSYPLLSGTTGRLWNHYSTVPLINFLHFHERRLNSALKQTEIKNSLPSWLAYIELASAFYGDILGQGTRVTLTKTTLTSRILLPACTSRATQRGFTWRRADNPSCGVRYIIFFSRDYLIISRLVPKYFLR